MFKLNETTVTVDSTKTTFYGIEDEEFSFNALCKEKDKAEELCKILNETDISKLHYNDIIEDFMNGISFGILGEKDP